MWIEETILRKEKDMNIPTKTHTRDKIVALTNMIKKVIQDIRQDQKMYQQRFTELSKKQ